MIYIDLVINYNNLIYKKKIAKLLSGKNRVEVSKRLQYDGNFAYGLDFLLDDKTNDQVFNKLNIKRINLKKSN